MIEPIEDVVKVGDMDFAARVWGDPTGTPVLALHGWLDNAASFDLLAPMLEGCCVVALDLSGHGLSSHRPYNSSYLIWADLVDLLSVADHYGWNTFNLVAHSRGGIIATLLAIAAPDRVDKLVTLDTLMPMPSPAGSTTNNLREYIRDERKYLQRKRESAEQRPFETLDIAIRARQQVMPIEKDSARRILERGTRKVEGGYVWRHDERLKGRSAVKFTAAQNEVMYADLDVETLLIVAPSAAKRMTALEEMVASNGKVTLSRIDGNHHFHMEAQAPDVAKQIVNFLADGAE